MIHHVTRITRFFIFWSLIIIALLLTAVRVTLWQLADYKTTLEQQIQRIAQLPVHIGSLQPRMRGINPELILNDLSIDVQDDSGKPAIQLKELRLGLSLFQWLIRGDALSAGWVSLVGAKVSVIRNLDGSFSIKGLNSSKEQPLWLLQGGHYEILQSEITWQDLQRHGAPVTFNQFDLSLTNSRGGTRHQVNLLSRLPATYGESLRISADLTGNPFVANDLSGRVYLEGKAIHWNQLIRGDLPDGWQIHDGLASVQLWSDWRNAMPYHLTAQVQGKQIRLQQGDKQLALDSVEGGFDWRREADHWRLQLIDLSVGAAKQNALQAAVYDDGRIAAAIAQLDLQTLNPLMAFLPPAFAQWRLQGLVNDSRVFIAPNAEHYALDAHFQQLGSNAVAGIPQLAGLDGAISGDDRQGALTLHSVDGKLAFPDLFRGGFSLQQLDGTLRWQQTPQQWQITSPQLVLNTPDFHTRSRLKLQLPKDRNQSPVMALETAFDHFSDISKAKQYYPVTIMDQGVVAWLDDAFVAGNIPRGQLTVRGALDKFPFENGGGRFEVAFDMVDTELQFNEQWPHLTDVHAGVQFLGNGVRVSIERGQSEKVQIKQAFVEIPSFSDSEQILINGQLNSGLPESLAFLQKTPLRSKIDGLSNTLTVAGNSNIKLDLGIAFNERDPNKVDVRAQLANARLTVKPVALLIDSLNGELRFTDQGIFSEQLDGMLMGLPVRGKIHSDQDSTRIEADGMNNVANLQKQFSFLRNEFASGVFGYQAVLDLPFAHDEPSKLTLSSDLQGVILTLPDNLAKTSEQKIPLKLEMQLDGNRNLPLMLSYGEQLTAALLIDKVKSGLRAAHLVYGEGFAVMPEQEGLSIDIRQPVFKLSSWQEWLGRDPNRNQGLPINAISLNTNHLLSQGREFGLVNLALKHQAQSWQGTVSSKMAKGWLQIPDALTADSRIKLAMEFLDLTELSQLELSSQSAFSNAQNLPLIDISSEKLWWHSVDLGRLKLETERLANGVHFKKLTLSGKNRQINLSADWVKQGEGTATTVTGTLKMDGFGQFLSDLKVSDEIKETHADMRFEGGWQGAPHEFSLAHLNGKLEFHLTDGRLASIEPGFGRLLGLIAMEQWAKRLSLDFSDVYQKGLAFDDITGSFKVVDGLATTDDLLIDAVAAKMRIVGEVNLANKTVNQRVAVTPKSADAVPIAGKIVGGVASVITQIVTGNDKEGYFFGSEYQLSGQWGDVQVTPRHEQDGLFQKTWRGLTDFSWLKSGKE